MLQVFGSINNPLTQVSNLDAEQVDVKTGLPFLISNIFLTISVIAGLFALFNLVSAGLTWVTSGGDPKGIEGARNKIFMSLIGLVIIAGSYGIASVVGLLLFRDAGALTNVRFFGPGAN